MKLRCCGYDVMTEIRSETNLNLTSQEPGRECRSSAIRSVAFLLSLASAAFPFLLLFTQNKLFMI